MVSGLKFGEVLLQYFGGFAFGNKTSEYLHYLFTSDERILVILMSDFNR